MNLNELSRRNILQLGLLGVGAGVVPAAIDMNIARAEELCAVPTRQDPDRLRDFVALSEVLTGVKPLDHDLAPEYMERFEKNPMVGPFLGDLLNAYRSITLLNAADQEKELTSRILDPKAVLRPAAEQLVYLWYISAFAFRDQANPNKVIWQYGTEDQYNRALIWKVIHGHPPMTTPSEWASESLAGVSRP